MTLLKKSVFIIKIEYIIFIFLIVQQPAQAKTPVLPAFRVKAKAAVLINALSGQILFEQDADERIPPASLAKLMTLYLAFDAMDNGQLQPTDPIRISKKAWQQGGSKMFLEVGTQVPLLELLKGIAVVSGNDACIAVAEEITGVEEVFIAKMNKKAANLGMADTHFANCHGLPAKGQVTTAKDMAILAYHYLQDHPNALEIHSIKEMAFNNITQQSRNGLLWLDYGVDGLKTGWFSSAGFHLIATAEREGDRFIAVVMGAKKQADRENAALKLLNYGFRNFKTLQLFNPEKSLATTSVWYGAKGEVALVAVESSFITIPREDEGGIELTKDFPARVFAPIEKNQEIGNVRVSVDGKYVKTVPLVAFETVARAGFFKRTLHGIILFFILPPYWGVVSVLLFVFVCVFIIYRNIKSKKDKRTAIFE